ncbi:circularly permuted type 2 ATP-grasp protein [Phytohabitans aurantiacus]|uniref:Circularly permuted ATP-grasp type 2 domain-containing protein n=1 Tax=Phytohabitans aurantiacus TaxID=3016789 RepID=A0ABQ5QZP5_9ACTN|nr:circularly permuted type 2 ATP-grasp protein [Phytohabitans aurantiacus]GLH99770.1 hypothetical protein Pa4123_50460 [Phytohabitans aurantiacus]
MAEPVRVSARGLALHEAVRRRCAELGPAKLTARRSALERDYRRRGVDFLTDLTPRYFRHPDDDGHLNLDPVPYVITTSDWDRIVRGYAQRLPVFDDLIRVLVDRDQSVIPSHIMDSCAYDRAALAVLTRQRRAVTFVGSDAMVHTDGHVQLVEDNPCTASGMVYGALLSTATRRLVDEFAGFDEDPVIEIGQAIRRVHEELCDTVSAPRIVYLTHGPADPNFVEHAIVAESAGFDLADPEDVTVGGDGTVRLLLGDGTRQVVDLVVCNHSRRFRLTGQLLDAVAKARVPVVNHPATFALSDKYLFGYLPELIRRRYGVAPLLGQPDTVPLIDAGDRRKVFADIREYVIKPRKGLGGKAVLIGATANDEEIRAMREVVSRRSHHFLAQPRVVAARTTSLSRTGGPESLISSVFDIRISGYVGTASTAIAEPLVRADLHGKGLVNVSAGGAQKPMYRVAGG